MTKRLCLFLSIIVLSSFMAFSEATVFMKHFSSSFLVNLASNNYVAHGDDPDWAHENPSNPHPSTGDNKYYDNQMLCTLGVQNTDKDVTFTFSLDSGHWLYLLDETDLRFSRPFGVDLIIRGNGASGHTTLQVNGKKISHMGLSSAFGDNHSGSVSFTIPASAMQNYQSIWFDICLVMDSPLDTNGQVYFADTDTTYTVTPHEDNYRARITVSVKNEDIVGGSSTYYIDLLGYYRADGSSPEALSAILDVIPTAAASSLDIETLSANKIEQIVASYRFTTSTVGAGNGKVYFFLSSTESGSGSLPDEDGFSLKYTKNNRIPSVLNKYNSVAYEAKIVSNEYNKETVFDGTTGFGTTEGILNTYHAVEPDSVSTTTGHGNLVRWHDSGVVKVKMTGNVDDLVAGLYTSTIYFHVVTNF